LLDRLEKLWHYGEGSSNVPSVIFIAEGEHVGGTVFVKIPTSIIGAGREKTTLLFRVEIKGKKSAGPVVMEDLTIKNGEG
jgi:hypothetical protein